MLFLITKLTALLNHWFAAPLDALLATLGIHVAHPSRPIGTSLTMQLIVMTILLLWSRRRSALNVSFAVSFSGRPMPIAAFCSRTGEARG